MFSLYFKSRSCGYMTPLSIHSQQGAALSYVIWSTESTGPYTGQNHSQENGCIGKSSENNIQIKLYMELKAKMCKYSRK